MNKKLSKKGFTLVEILAVIVILGIILGIGIPSASNLINKSKKSAFYASVSNIVNKISYDDLAQNSEYCVYSYSEDDENQNKNIVKLYVIAQKANNKIVYSVYAKGNDESYEIDAKDFSNTSQSDPENWIKTGDESYGSTLKEVSSLGLNGLKKYNYCGMKKGGK